MNNKEWNIFQLSNDEIYIKNDLTELDKKVLESLLRLFKPVPKGKLYNEYQISSTYFALRIEELSKFQDLKKAEIVVNESLNKIKKSIMLSGDISIFKKYEILKEKHEDFDYYNNKDISYEEDIYIVKYLWKWSYEELDNLRDFIVPNSATSNKLKRLG